jgi:hypothetical protein
MSWSLANESPHQQSGDAATSVSREDVNVANTPQSNLWLVGIMADASHADQFLSGEGSDENFTGAIKSLRTVEPTVAEAEHEPSVAVASFRKQIGKEQLGIANSPDLIVHRSSTA